MDNRERKRERRRKRLAKRAKPTGGTPPSEKPLSKRVPLRPDPTAVAACGDCTLCCDVLGIKVEEGERRLSEKSEDGSLPPNEPCRFCSKEDGCAIYEEPDRPEPCRSFECWWLQSQRTNLKMPVAQRPDYLGAVIVGNDDTGTVTFNVPVDRHGEWNIPGRMADLIRSLDSAGLAVFVACGDYQSAVSRAAVAMIERAQKKRNEG